MKALNTRSIFHKLVVGFPNKVVSFSPRPVREHFERRSKLRVIRRQIEAAERYAEDNSWNTVLGNTKVPSLSIVVPTFNRIEQLIDCILSIRKFTSNYEIIVVNSGSGALGDQWLSRQREFGDLIVILDNGRKNGKRVHSQSYFYNLGYKVANGKYVVHFADDCQATPGWIDEAVEMLEMDRTIGLAILLGQPRTEGEFSHTVCRGRYRGRPHDYAVAHWFCARKEDLAKIGFMDESYNYYYNDLDLTMRVTWDLGLRALCCRRPALLHRDKNITYRQPGAGDGDLELFSARWREKAGIPDDNSDWVNILSEKDTQDWFARKEFRDALSTNASTLRE